MTRRTTKSVLAATLGGQQLEARLGARLAAALSLQSEQLAPDISERLRFARQRALECASAAHAARTGASVVAGRGGVGTLVLGGFVDFWQRAAAVMPLIMLVAGLVAIDHWSAREQLVAVADVDAQLLSDNLPPSAYSDPGFIAFLRSAPLP